MGEAGVFLTFSTVVVLLFLIGPVYGWVSEWRRAWRPTNKRPDEVAQAVDVSGAYPRHADDSGDHSKV